MKKIFLLLISIGIFNITYGQCDEYGHRITTSSFNCPLTSGDICFTTTGDWTSGNNCYDYVVQIEFPQGDFIYTDLGSYGLVSGSADPVVLQTDVFLIADGFTTVCLSGLLQEPGTEFIYRIVHPTTGDIVESGSFFVDDEETIGTVGSTTLLSQAILDGDLLSASLSPLQGQKVNINGTLIVDQDYVFNSGEINSSIRMGPGSSIQINPNIKLSINNTKVYSCGDKWNNILVGNGSELTTVGSTISNATTAIELLDGSSCTVFRCIFEANDVGIGSYGSNWKDIDFNFYGSPWHQTVFRDGDVGIRLEFCNQVKPGRYWNYFNMIRGISLNQTDIIVDHNYFYNNAHGIDAYYAEHESSIIDISDCSFYGNSNITGRGIEITGSQVSNIEDNYFYELELGIFLSNGALYEVSDIIDNTMEKVEYGIRGVGHNSRCDIKDNDIRSESHSVMVFGTWGEYQQQWATQYNDRISSLYGTPILYNNMNNGRIFKNDWIISEGHGTGVKINGGTFNHVGYNDIEGWINNSRGIGVSGTDLSSVYCNYTGTDDGIGVYGNNSGTELRENRLATSINSIEYGSTLNGFAHTGIQDYKGNRFGISTSSSPKATNYSVLNVAEQNRFLVGILAGNQGTVLYPYFTSADNNWFNPDNVGADSDNCFPGFTSVTGLTDNELKKVVDGDVSIIEIVKNPYGEDIEFETVVTTIEHITKYNEQTGGNFYNSILTDPDYFDAAQLVGIENDLNAILNEELITDAEYDTWQSDINNVISDIESYELFTYDITTDQLISNSNSQYYQGLLASLETIKSRHSTEISAKQLELDQVVPLLKSRLQSLPRPTSGAGKYLSDITSIGLNVLTSNFTEFSQSQITMINAISEKCGYKYGKSVYLARSLRAIYETNSIPDYVSCDDIPMNNISKKLDISPAMVNFSLYPNPASEVITLSISNIDGGSFEIFNTLGLIVEKIIIEPKIKSVDINISEYPAGIYMMKDVTGIQKTIKFIKTN